MTRFKILTWEGNFNGSITLNNKISSKPIGQLVEVMLGMVGGGLGGGEGSGGGDERSRDQDSQSLI